MPRPQKEGLDYFPLDTDMDQDDKILLIEAKHGIVGFGIILKLFLKIYREGYYYRWQEKEQLLFSRRVNVAINQVNEVINDAVKWGLFDEGLFKKHAILTSCGIQKRYLKGAQRRQNVEIQKKYLLLDEKFLSDYNNVVIADTNPVNVYPGTQSKVKESKVKESKGKEYCPNSASPDPPPPSQEVAKFSVKDKNSKSKPKQGGAKKYTRESMPFKAAVNLRQRILENNPRARVPPEDPAHRQMQTWALEMDRLNRIGPPGSSPKENKGYSWEEITELINYCQDDHFWQANILSAAKLREQAVKLENQQKRKKPNKLEHKYPAKGEQKEKLLQQLYQQAKEEEEHEKNRDP